MKRFWSTRLDGDQWVECYWVAIDITRVLIDATNLWKVAGQFVTIIELSGILRAFQQVLNYGDTLKVIIIYTFKRVDNWIKERANSQSVKH